MHRDLKLENLMLGEDGYIQMIDFGLSKFLDEGQSAHKSTGTREYMAPEMFKVKSYNKSIDWWALGILLYEMFFGFTPFYHSSK